MKMFSVSFDEAQALHGIKCEHSRAESGELRFRLLKNDGTAYIRTESPPHGGWQDSHWHRKVLETYIVQEGWMGYAELKDGETHLQVYRAGELFTTVPEVIHNVYLPKGAVIHTVKHGNPIGEMRLEDESTKAFTENTRKISESVLLSAASASKPKQSASQVERVAGDYSDAYKHFDNLIWQAPVWSSAIFTIAILGTPSFESKIVQTFGVPIGNLLSCFYGLVGASLLSFSYALYRFRWHHLKAKNYMPNGRHVSPQVGLQLIVNLQSACLIIAAFLAQGYSPVPLVLCGVSIIAIATFFGERKLGIESLGSGHPTSTRS